MKRAGQIKRSVILTLVTLSLLVLEISSFAQNKTLPNGTLVRLRVIESLDSQTAQKGQIINFEVVEDVRIGNLTFIAQRALATGIITKAQAKRSFNRNGNLSLRLDYVKAVDGSKVPLRIAENAGANAGAKEIAIKQRITESVNTPLMQSGRLGGVSSMLLTGLTRLPAPPMVSLGSAGAITIGRWLIKKGSNVGIVNGQLLDAFVDGSVVIKGRKTSSNRLANYKVNVRSASGSHPVQIISQRPTSPEMATVNLISDTSGAEIKIDGAFAGNTPSTVRLPAGRHKIAIGHGNSKDWVRTIDLTAGSNISLKANAQKSPDLSAKNTARQRN